MEFLQRPVRLVVIGAVALLVAASLGLHWLRFLRFAIASIFYPYELDYGEGIVWQQALLMLGPRMYGDINQYPFVVFHYPPFYHVMVRAVSALGIDMLVAGRSISLLAALVIGAVCARLTYLATPVGMERGARLVGAMSAGLTVFCCLPVIHWAALMRVDMLAVALSIMGVLAVVSSAGRPFLVYVGGLFFLLAIYTKQTSLAAPIASLPLLLTIFRRRTVVVGCLTLVVGCGMLLLLEIDTGGGFLRHIVLYNVNRYRFASLIDGIELLWPQAIFFIYMVGGLIVGWRNVAKGGSWRSFEIFKREVAESISTRTLYTMTIYLLLTTCMIPLLGKSGAGQNYLIETMCVWSIFVGIFTAWLIERLTEPWSKSGRTEGKALPVLSAVFFLWLLFIQTQIMPTSVGEYNLVTPQYRAALDSLMARIARANKPVLSDDMVLLMRAGKEVPWEPAIFTELASQGRWDQRLIIDRINSREFAMIVTSGRRGSLLFDARYTPEVSRAIEAAYPYSEQVAGRTVRLPVD
jgi:hypothetical protein